MEKTTLKKVCNFLKKLFNPLFKTKDEHSIITEEKYYERFGIIKTIKGYKVRKCKKELLEKAYLKAWENRDFEINKFWTRAAYFWGFIVLTLGGYITLLTSISAGKAIKMHLDLYLVLLGFLFSITWYLVILGSKNWQRNWEQHIDMLEDYVSGPIYKTIYYSKKGAHSVSKLNEVMALFVMIVWSVLLLQHLIEHFTFEISKDTDIFPTIAIVLTFVFAISLTFGYSSGSYTSIKDDKGIRNKGFIDRWE